MIFIEGTSVRLHHRRRRRGRRRLVADMAVIRVCLHPPRVLVFVLVLTDEDATIVWSTKQPAQRSARLVHRAASKASAVVASSFPVVVPSSAARRAARRPPDAVLSVAGQMALLVESAVAFSSSVVTRTAVVTRFPVHSHPVFSFAPVGLHVPVFAALVVVAVPVDGVTSTALRAAGVVGPAVVTKRAVAAQRTTVSTAATAGRPTTMTWRAVFSIALAAVVVGCSVVRVHSRVWRGAVGVVGPAVVPRSMRYVMEGLHGALGLVIAAAGSVERFAGRPVDKT